MASHVLSVDVLSRDIVKRPFRKETSLDAAGVENQKQELQHVLKTTRLILKKGTLPKWAPKGLIRNAESWVLEESEVELDPFEQGDGVTVGREFRVWTRNLDHTTVLAVTESNIFKERLQQREQVKDDSFVSLKSIYHVTSNVSFSMLRNRVEKFGLNRVLTHVDSVSVCVGNARRGDV